MTDKTVSDAPIANVNDLVRFETTPLAERNLPSSTYAALKAGADRNPSATALTFFADARNFRQATRYTFAELLARIHQAANAFSELGVGPNDVVSILLPNAPEAHFAFWGAEAVGIANPINPLLEPDHIAEILNAAGTKVLVTLAPLPGTDLWAKVEAIRGRVPSLRAILQVNLAEHLPFPKSLVVRALTTAKRMRQGGGVPVRDFSSTLAAAPADRVRAKRTITSETIASLFHTGGTTGAPKLARHTHGNEVFDAWSGPRGFPVSPDNVFLCGLPLFHVNGVIVTGLLPWMHGASVVMATPQGYRGPGLFENFWAIVEHYRVALFSAVPAVYTTLLQTPIGDRDVSSLLFAISGAAALPRHVCQEFESRTGLKILEGYGLTEGTCISAVNPAFGERRNGSIGLRLAYQEMKVVRLTADGKLDGECAADEIGEIVIRGPNVFAGYVNAADDKNAWLVDPAGGKPFLRTGDLGRQDAEGYFWLTGRKKELIIRGGHNIDPRSIEEPMQTHAGVAMVAAVGRPDPRVGEVPVAYVTLKPGSTATTEELLDHATRTIPERAAIPKKIYVVDALPLTPIGKVFKPDLTRRQIEEVFHEEIAPIGVSEYRISAAPHKVHGMLVDVEVAAPEADRPRVEKAIRDRLGAYSVRYEVRF
ncbi:MAG: acyl-CoA synthetase [Bdellovibrionales bacterium]|nr:acyl-CoA synthetase [Bdellovibrionales bacterium]